ncbi:hypothetical protein EZS27_014757 [termite gut metagenome]|uniref:FRG domain-containing protein n=1 Tax=termite gut metagenome TaxID=433724 RepID=A0A5J4RVZ1_9ZZZZ
MKLSESLEYSSLEEKEEAFKSTTINTIDELDEEIQKIQNKNLQYSNGTLRPFIFRGVNEAKFKLFTSAQRQWIKEEMEPANMNYFNYIKSLINKSLINDARLANIYEQSSNIDWNNLFVMSFLQHYGYPTPILDFTYDIYKGLFFGLYDKKPSDLLEDNTNINNYFSLYIVPPQNGELCSIVEVYNIDRCKVDAIITSFNEYYSNMNLETNLVEEKMKKFSLEDLFEYKLLYIPGDQIYSFKIFQIPAFQAILDVFNPRQERQEGAFIFLGDGKNPLECYFTSGCSNENPTFHIAPIECLNINKSLRNSIEKKYLIPREINENTMLLS